jgi:hypothetical protein
MAVKAIDRYGSVFMALHAEMLGIQVADGLAAVIVDSVTVDAFF